MSNQAIKPLLYPGNADLAEKLRRDQPEAIINLVGSIKGKVYFGEKYLFAEKIPPVGS